MKEYSCLIAEDSSIECEGLRFLLNAKGYPLRITEAANGETALDIIEHGHIDLLITDIRMPFVSGLELARAARQKHQGIKIIICSAYSEFSYAKQAIEQSVSGYLLKPVQRSEFWTLIEKLLGELESQSQEDKRMRLELEKCWYDIMHGYALDDAMDNRLQAFRIDMHSVKPIIALLHFGDQALVHSVKALEQALTRHADGVWVMDMYTILLLINADKLVDADALIETASDIQQAALSIVKRRPAILIVQPKQGTLQLCESFRRIEEQGELCLYESGSIHILDELASDRDVELLESLNCLLSEASRSLDSRKSEDAYARIEELAARLRLFNSSSALYTRYVAIEAISLIRRGSNNTSSLKSIMDEVLSMRNSGQMAALIERHMQALLPSSNACNDVHAIDKILRIIHERYMDELTLDFLAHAVYLSPPYVSYLFRKHTGTTLIKYMTEYRMKRASEMLSSCNRSITDVAMQVGYDNASYFSSLFKARYGVTPAQYSRLHRNGGTRNE